MALRAASSALSTAGPFVTSAGANATRAPSVLASYLPETWDVGFVDENAGAASDADFQWADAVLVSGMHVQRAFINDIVARAHRHGRVVVLGGPSVSSCPEYYPEADLLHVGELGDATDRITEYLATHRARPRRPPRFETATRLP